MRVSFLQVEMDGNDAGAIIGRLAESVFGQPARLMETAAIAAPEPLALPAAQAAELKPKRKYKPREKHDQVEARSQAKPLTIAEAVRQAVADRGRTNGEVLNFVRMGGLEADSKSIAQALWLERKRGTIYKDDRDLRWRKSERPE